MPQNVLSARMNESESNTPNQSVETITVTPATPVVSTPINNVAWWHAPFAGVFGGMTGGAVTYPFEGCKKRAQSGQLQPWQMPGIRPHTFGRELYRGGSSFILSLAPVSMLQVSFNKYLKSLLPENPSAMQVNAAGVASGAIGALFSAPVEHLILTQQKQKIGLVDAMKYLYRRSPTYCFTALPPLLVREAVFGSVMLSTVGMPLPQQILVGIVGAGISHPFDAIGTRKQESKVRISMTQAAKEILAEKGWKGFYAGYLFRSFLFTGCMITIGHTQRYIQDSLKAGKALNFFKPASNERMITNKEEVQDKHAPRPK